MLMRNIEGFCLQVHSLSKVKSDTAIFESITWNCQYFSKTALKRGGKGIFTYSPPGEYRRYIINTTCMQNVKTLLVHVWVYLNRGPTRSRDTKWCLSNSRASRRRSNRQCTCSARLQTGKVSRAPGRDV